MSVNLCFRWMMNDELWKMKAGSCFQSFLYINFLSEESW